jgi:hypothetical protein
MDFLGGWQPLADGGHFELRNRTIELPLRNFHFSSHPRIGDPVNIHISLAPLISLVAGILILLMPKLLNFIVAIYLILIGLVGLFGTRMLHFT